MMWRIKTHAIQIATPLVLVALWWALSAGSTSPYFPPLRDILVAFANIWGSEHLWNDLLPSLASLAIGMLLTLAIGLSLGVLLGNVSRLERAFAPVTEFMRAMPVAAVVPIGLVVLGPGLRMEVAIIVFASIWPILLATIDGVKGVDPVTLEVAQVYGLDRRRRITDIVIPAALPQIAAGIRIGIANAVAAMIIANMFGSVRGLGYFIVNAQQSFDVRATWAGLLMIGLIGCSVSGLYALFQYRALAWHRGWRTATEGT
jgi:sulfonate transport system permease protein